jgi:hypothetical protein
MEAVAVTGGSSLALGILWLAVADEVSDGESVLKTTHASFSEESRA